MATSVLASVCVGASDVDGAFPDRKVYSEDFGYTYVYMIALAHDHIMCLYHYGDDYLMIAFEGRITKDGSFEITHASAEDKNGTLPLQDAMKVDSYPLDCVETVFKVTCDYKNVSNISIPDWDTFHNNFMDIVECTEQEKHKTLYYITQQRGEDLLIP